MPLIDAVQRLAAYEDTGLEPEAVEHLKLASMGKAIAEIKEFDGLPIDRLRELARADKDGRCVVLPCNVGDTVWRIYDDCVFPGICGKKMRCKGCEYRNLFAEEQAFCLSMLSQNGKLEHPFYTRKEAATALSTLRAENEKLRAELESVRAERNAAVEDVAAIIGDVEEIRRGYGVDNADADGAFAELCETYCANKGRFCYAECEKYHCKNFKWRGI